jgi:hypothetical protein
MMAASTKMCLNLSNLREVKAKASLEVEWALTQDPSWNYPRKGVLADITS